MLSSLAIFSQRMVREINCPFSWTVTIKKKEDRRVVVHQSKKFSQLLQHADVGDPAGRRIALRRHHNNVITYQELHAGHKPVLQETNA